jgi:hypothetical protein
MERCRCDGTRPWVGTAESTAAPLHSSDQYDIVVITTVPQRWRGEASLWTS